MRTEELGPLVDRRTARRVCFGFYKRPCGVGAGADGGMTGEGE